MRNNKRAIRLIAAFLPLPFIVAGAISAGVIGVTAWNLHSEAEIANERAEAQAAEEAEFRKKYGDQSTWEVPPLVVVEPWNPDDANAPS